MSPKREIDLRPTAEVIDLVEKFPSSTNWAAVRVLDHGCNPGMRGSGAAGHEVLAIRGRRIHEMNMSIDHARHHQ
jgi:hypothetical protein